MTQQEASSGAGSCNTLLNDYFGWGSQQNLQDGNALIDCNVAVFQRGALMGIFSGTLKFTPGRVEVDLVQTPTSFSGELTRLYSRRSESSSDDHEAGEDDSGAPQHIPHRIHIAISGGTGPVMRLSPPTVAIAVESQSNSQFSFVPQCLAGSMYGVGKALGMRPGGIADPESLYVVGLSNQHYVANA